MGCSAEFLLSEQSSHLISLADTNPDTPQIESRVWRQRRQEPLDGVAPVGDASRLVANAANGSFDVLLGRWYERRVALNRRHLGGHVQRNLQCITLICDLLGYFNSIPKCVYSVFCDTEYRITWWSMKFVCISLVDANYFGFLCKDEEETACIPGIGHPLRSVCIPR